MAEDHVAAHLIEAGWAVVDRNWRGRGGELDLVVSRRHHLRFVEVKARTSDGLDPLESITSSKRARLVRAAVAWLETHVDRVEASDEVCFLVAVVDLGSDPWGVELLDNAFDVVSRP